MSASAPGRPQSVAGPAAQAANTNDAGLGASAAAVPAIADWSRRLDDGTLLRWLFRIVLIGTLVVLALDLQEIRRLEADALGPGGESAPFLPPSLSDGSPDAPPFDIFTAPETLKQPARFELRPGGVLRVEGAFDIGSSARFAAEIDARGEYVSVIELDSPGGSVDDAIVISTLIRERGFATRVTEGALCASSCPIVMAGGVERSAEPGAVVGVHQVYGAGGQVLSAAHAMSQAQATTARVARHLSEMGIESGLWVHALETPPDRLYYLSPDEMKVFGLTTLDAA